MIKKVRLLIALAMLTIFLTACGGGSSSGSAAGGQDAGAAGASQAENQQDAVTIETIQTDIPAGGVINTEGYGSLSKTDPTWQTAPQYALIGADGEFVFDYGAFPCRIELYDGIFVNGIVQDQVEGRSIGVYSLFDLSGAQIIDQTYDYLSFFNGYGVGITRTRTGEDAFEYVDDRVVINTDGEEVLTLPDGFNLEVSIGGGDFEFELRTWTMNYFGSVGGYGDGLLWVSTAADIEQNISEAQGLTKETPGILEKCNQIAWYGGPYCGYIDLQGNVVIPLQYYSALAFSEGLAAVREYVAPSVPIEELSYGANLGGLWKYINKEGETVFGGYTDASNFQNGYAYVANDEGKYGYIDLQGEVVVPMMYDAAFGTGDGLFTVGQNTGDQIRYGMVDAENNVVVPLEYDDISIFCNGGAYAIKDGTVVILQLT